MYSEPPYSMRMHIILSGNRIEKKTNKNKRQSEVRLSQRKTDDYTQSKCDTKQDSELSKLQ